MSARAAVFLDRDGTLIYETGYLGDPAGLVLYPGAAAALAQLSAAGFALVVVTNQSGVARGLFGEQDVARVHARLRELCGAAGARLDLVLYCPHHPTAGLGRYKSDCDCRKPKPGMFLRAARALGLDLSHCHAVGDAVRDAVAARDAGVRGLFLVATGKGHAEREQLASAGLDGCRLVPDVGAAARAILGGLAGSQRQH